MNFYVTTSRFIFDIDHVNLCTNQVYQVLLKVMGVRQFKCSCQ